MKKHSSEQPKEEVVEMDSVLSEEDLNETAENEEPQCNENEYLEMAQRIQAEFDNYRKRTQDVQKNSWQDGVKHAVEMLLPVIDSINSAKRQVADENFKKSIELLYSQTIACFEKLGVKKIEATGKPFNPELHNAIMTEHQDGVEPDMVLDELQEGFELNGKVIRHSVVKVSQ
jgi:molecular chaperone GrpE